MARAVDISMRKLTFEELPGVLGSAVLNLLRRGVDGSLRLSADRWSLASVEEAAVVFRSQLADPLDEVQVLEVPRQDVQQLTWDRLPKQQARSQVRFHLTTGDLWTFSGQLNEPD